MKHCNKPLEIKTGKENSKTLYYAQCEVCKMKKKDVSKKVVEEYFTKNDNDIAKNGLKGSNAGRQLREQNTLPAQLQPLPKKRTELINWQQQNMPALINQSAQFIDKPATTRMIEKNIRYVSNLSGKSWDKIWSTEQGQESISHALAEALYHGATLGDMGDLVPFGNTAEFIANVECYKHALETGKNAPFKDISIDLVHENDQTTNEQVDGNFIFTIKRGIPRGEVIAVVVQAVRIDSGKNIGEIYDADRLIEKAKQHSPSYRNYLKDKEEFTILKTSGKLGKDKAGRDCIVKKGQYGEYYVYESDLSNPYEGPDRPEMLRKSAGKSFFRPYMKVRNASAMADEWNDDDNITDDMSRDEVADGVLSQAVGQFQDDPIAPQYHQPIKDAEIVEPEETEKKVEEKKEVDKKETSSQDDESLFKL